MDDANAGRDVIHAEYRFLAKLNRLGATAEHVVGEVARRGARSDGVVTRIVDFGSGGGSVAARLSEVAVCRGEPMAVTASDRSPVAVEYASARADGRYETVLADLLDSPFAPAAFGVSYCSLVLHHLPDPDVVRALRAMADAASDLVIWIDLVRDHAGIAGAWLSTIGWRSELRHDAVASVRRGFTRNEAQAAAEAAGIREINIRRLSFGRFMLSGKPGPVPARRPTVRATDLSVSFGTLRVLHSASLEGHAGEVVAVRGPNGVGKSTLLACLVGARRPDRGHIWADRSLGSVGFHPQEGGLFAELDARANIATFARIAGVRATELDGAVRDAIGRWGLAGCSGRPVSKLSGGLRRRAALAACLAHQPHLLVLDEPEAGLDADGRDALWRHVRHVTAAGGTAIVSCHDPAAAIAIGGTVVELGMVP